MADEQRINSVDRFRKQPGRFVLEEHSHCEVPAGCGGVVLRWRNPLAGRPLSLRLFTAGPARCFIDGNLLENTLIDLPPGPHLMALALEPVALSSGFFAFAALGAAEEPGNPAPGQVVEAPVKILSAADGSWKYSLVEPEGDGWHTLSFSDDAWPAFTEAAPPAVDNPDSGSWRLRSCTSQGAVCLGLAGPEHAERPVSWLAKLTGRRSPSSISQPANPTTSRVWIRKRLEIPTPRMP